MRVHVIHAHPVETSFNRTLFRTTIEALQGAGHEVDALDLYGDAFSPALTREERLNYHNVPENLTPEIKPYVDRLRAAEALVVVHPVWNYGYPAILKGYFDRVFLPGVSFTMEGGGDRGKLVPCLDNIRKVAFVTTYGGTRFRTWLLGDPPRRIAMRWGWVTFKTRPKYLALYDMNNVTPGQLNGFLGKVRTTFGQF